MKKSLFALSLVAICALTACSGNKVSQEKFKEEANKIEDHDYTEATLKIKGSYELSGLGEGFDGSESVDDTFKYTYDAQEKEWKAEKEEGEEYLVYVGSNVKDLNLDKLSLEEAKAYVEDGDINVVFYVNPLKIEMTVDAKLNVETEYMPGVSMTETGTVKGNETMTFDKYGYLTSEVGKMDINITMTAAGQSMTLVMKEDLNVTISYK